MAGEGLPPALGTATEELRSTLERQVREIVEAAEAKAAEIEDRALEQASQVEQYSQRKAREHVQTSIERTDRMVAAIDAFERQVEIAIGSLRSQAEALATELADEQASDPPPPPPASQANGNTARAEVADPTEEEDAPEEEEADEEWAPDEEETPEEAAEVAHTPDHEADPDRRLEAREMLRQQITHLRASGKPRAEAERYLSRLNEGEQYLDVLDDIYGETEQMKPSASRRRRLRRRRAKQHEPDG